jgi:chemotaxis response regulator CheB
MHIMEKIKVLVVDDAAFMVKAVSELLESDPDIKIVGFARNGQEGLEKIKTLHPDVITLDIDMPVMDGVTAIRHIMIESPVPIVVLSSLFSDGAITFEALRLGVVDFLPKPSGAISRDIHRAKQQLIDRVKLAAVVNMQNVRRVKNCGNGTAASAWPNAMAFNHWIICWPLAQPWAVLTPACGCSPICRLICRRRRLSFRKFLQKFSLHL